MDTNEEYERVQNKQETWQMKVEWAEMQQHNSTLLPPKWKLVGHARGSVRLAKKLS